LPCGRENRETVQRCITGQRGIVPKSPLWERAASHCGPQKGRHLGSRRLRSGSFSGVTQQPWDCSLHLSEDTLPKEVLQNT
jgi:hypothetical protein